jgi:DNA-binding MarR family transcriptional regulator
MGDPYSYDEGPGYEPSLGEMLDGLSFSWEWQEVCNRVFERPEAEEWAYLRFCDDAEDWITSWIDGLPEDLRRDCLRRLRAQLARFEKPSEFVPTRNQLTVLQALRASPCALVQEDISAATRISRKTIGIVLKRLRALGFVCAPEGETKGTTLTDHGREYLANLQRRPS